MVYIGILLSRNVYFNVRRPPQKSKKGVRIESKREGEEKINGYCYNTKQCVPIKINEG